jgi:choline-glycine betaine transporter
MMLASLLMFVVLFSSGSESATYVVCVTGAGLWLVEQEAPLRPRNAALIGGLLLAGLAPTDLLSAPVRHLTNDYALKAIPSAIVWLLLTRDLLVRDFSAPAASPDRPGALEPAPAGGAA